MTKIKKLQESVTKAETKVEKCKGTIERHKKALDKKLKKVAPLGVTLENLKEKREEYRGTDESWELYEVERKLDDIKGATKKLAEAEAVLANWNEKLAKEQEKDNFINNNAPQVIIDFLEEWKAMAYEWYVRRYAAFHEFKAKLNEEVKEAEAELGMRSGYPPTREQRKILEEKELDWKSVRRRLANFAGNGVLKMCEFRDEEERLAWLNDMLEKEKKAKLLDLITRIKDVAGDIIDVEQLSINGGNLNGVVTGTKGKAKVLTFGAGGWNIMCFHYRTQVTAMK